MSTTLAPNTTRSLVLLSSSLLGSALRTRLALDSARGCALHALSTMRAIQDLRSARMSSSGRATAARAAMRLAAVEMAKDTTEAFASFANYNTDGAAGRPTVERMLSEIEDAPRAFDREFNALKSVAFDAAAELQRIIDARGGFCAPLERARDRAHRVACLSAIGMDRHDLEDITSALAHSETIFGSIAQNRMPLGDTRICDDETRRLSAALASARSGWAIACDASAAVAELRSAMDELQSMRG